MRHVWHRTPRGNSESCAAILLLRFFLLQHARRVPLDDVISRRRIPRIANGVQLIRRLENDRSRTDTLPLSIHERFHSALLDNEQFLIGMLMRRMRLLAGIERRNICLLYTSDAADE